MHDYGIDHCWIYFHVCSTVFCIVIVLHDPYTTVWCLKGHPTWPEKGPEAVTWGILYGVLPGFCLFHVFAFTRLHLFLLFGKASPLRPATPTLHRLRR